MSDFFTFYLHLRQLSVCCKLGREKKQCSSPFVHTLEFMSCVFCETLNLQLQVYQGGRYSKWKEHFWLCIKIFATLDKSDVYFVPHQGGKVGTLGRQNERNSSWHLYIWFVFYVSLPMEIKQLLFNIFFFVPHASISIVNRLSQEREKTRREMEYGKILFQSTPRQREDQIRKLTHQRLK